MKFTKKSVLLLLAAIALFVFTFWGYPMLANYLQADICLDEGGKWNIEKMVCENE